MPTSFTVRRIHALLASAGLMDQKQNILAGFGVASTSDLERLDAEALIQYLTDQRKARCQPMRNAIIHHLALMGYTSGQKPDYDRINNFIKSIGANNPKKKHLNQLSYQELHKVTTQVKAMYQNHIKA